MDREELYGTIVFGIACLGIVFLLLAVSVTYLLAVGAVACFCCCAYFGLLLHKEDAPVNSDRKTAQRRAAGFQPCIACGGRFDGDTDGTEYHIKIKREFIGIVSMHHKPACVIASHELLNEQIDDSGIDGARVISRNRDALFQYDMILDCHFAFEVSCDDKVNQQTFAFLRWYADNSSLVLVKFGGTDERGKSGRKYDRVPFLLPVTSDIVKSAVAEDESYAKRRAAAKARMRRSLSVCSNDIQQCRIMSQYARDTALTATISSAVEAPAVPHDSH